MTNLTAGTGTFSKDQTMVALLHGGAGPQDPKGEAFQNGLSLMARWLTQLPAPGPLALPASLSAIWLQAPAAVQTALGLIQLLERDPMFNAGFGASLQADGRARVSASLMDSRVQQLSAVINVEEVAFPSLLTLALRGERFSILDAQGAQTLATRLGIPRESLLSEKALERLRQMKTPPETSGRTGTVGAVVISATGDLAAATSTGGVGNETPGRVGDTPTSSGNFCDERIAVSCTGIGEQILSLGIGPRLATRVADGATLAGACAITLREAEARDYQLAFIAVQRVGSDGYAWACGEVNATCLWRGSAPGAQREGSP